MTKIINREFSLPEYCDVGSPRAAVEMDQESNGSSVEEVESPRSVADKRNWKSIKMNSHMQILKIRAEDSHIGEDIGEVILSLKDKFDGFRHFMIFSRPILPASPLSGKSTAN